MGNFTDITFLSACYQNNLYQLVHDLSVLVSTLFNNFVNLHITIFKKYIVFFLHFHAICTKKLVGFRNLPVSGNCVWLLEMCLVSNTLTPLCQPGKNEITT